MRKTRTTILAGALACVAAAVLLVTGCTPSETVILAAANTAGNLGLSAWFAIDDPDTKVKAALEDGRISPERYHSYLGMLEEDQKFR